MKLLHHSLVSTLCLFTLIFLSVPLFGVSVYTIDHYYCMLNAFDIENDQFVYRDSVELPQWGYGGIDVAIDDVTNTLFITFELGSGGGKDLEIVDSQTMAHKKVTIENGVRDLTAIVFDKKNRRLLATDRNSNFLHIINWDSVNETLSLEETIRLENIDYATDLAIHEDTLYVSEFIYQLGGGVEYYTYVKMYDMSNGFSYMGQVETGEDFVSIDYNEADDVIYGGGVWSTWNLSKFTDPNTIVKNIGTMVYGVAADDTTAGRVFVTAKDTTTAEWSIQMWDTSDWGEGENEPADPNYTDAYKDSATVHVSNLAGLVVGREYKPSLIDIVKVDDVNEFDCVSPVADDPNITYTIGISSAVNNHNNVQIVDYLPKEVTFVSATYPGNAYGYYDGYTHTYIWYLSSLSGYDPNTFSGDPNTYFTLTVKVNEWAEPQSSFINEVSVESNTSDGYAAHKTNVCCWTHPDAVSGVIYVDKDAVEDAGYFSYGGIEYFWAEGRNTGTCWEDAYRSLQDALARADECDVNEIWVAEGTYYPGIESDNTFEIPDGVEVYGGFNGTETSRSQRDWKTNKTILSGYIDGTSENVDVVTVGDTTVLDGFIVQDAGENGIYATSDDFEIYNCSIKDNGQYGIFSSNCNLLIEWSFIAENGLSGIFTTGNSKTAQIYNSKIYDNTQNGILCNQSKLTIKNSIISQNGSGGSSFYGINLYQPWDNPIIHNCTIAHNTNQGINYTGSNAPDIRNCILFFNNGNAEQLSEDTTTHFSCVQDPNEPNSISTDTYGDGNLKCDPNFAYDHYPYGYYHLNSGSNCIDAGDPYLTIAVDEVDMDNEDRDGDGDVDMGADEMTCSETSNPIDLSADGVINMGDYAIFSAAWLSHDPNDPSLPPGPKDPNDVYIWHEKGWGPLADINDDYDVDLDDLAILCDVDNWLWEACWKSSYQEMMMMGMESMVLSEATSSVSPALDIPESYKDGFEDEYNDMTVMVEFLENLWSEDDQFRKDMKKKDWEDLMAHIYGWLDDVENAYLIELKSEELESIRQ